MPPIKRVHIVHDLQRRARREPYQWKDATVYGERRVGLADDGKAWMYSYDRYEHPQQTRVLRHAFSRKPEFDIE